MRLASCATIKFSYSTAALKYDGPRSNMRSPKNPTYKMIDDKMQAGYVALEERDSVGACRLWLEAWQAILEVMTRSGMHSLDEFDDKFGGTQSVLNWVQDLEIELHNAGLKEPDYPVKRAGLRSSVHFGARRPNCGVA